jgi:hypothetical protein
VAGRRESTAGQAEVEQLLETLVTSAGTPTDHVAPPRTRQATGSRLSLDPDRVGVKMWSAPV